MFHVAGTCRMGASNRPRRGGGPGRAGAGSMACAWSMPRSCRRCRAPTPTSRPSCWPRRFRRGWCRRSETAGQTLTPRMGIHSIPAPHAVGVAVLHLRRDGMGLRLPIAPSIAIQFSNSPPTLPAFSIRCCVDSLSSVSICWASMSLITRAHQSGSGTPSARPGAMRGPPTSNEKLPLPITTTRLFSRPRSIARPTACPSA